MFIGHYAVAFAAKKVAPKISLGTLFLSSQFIDLLWPLLLLLGVEHVRIDPGNTAFTPLDFYDYPFTHSLVGVLFWSVFLGLVYFAVRRYARGGMDRRCMHLQSLDSRRDHPSPRFTSGARLKRLHWIGAFGIPLPGQSLLSLLCLFSDSGCM